MGIIMAKIRRATVLDDLPDCIVIQEILVWLPPKDLLLCRAVCKLWRSATSTDKFMLDNCRRQPSLPLIRQHIPGQTGVRFLVFRDDCARSSNQKLWPIIHDSKLHKLLGACDGLLILSDGSDFWICNPATRKYAPLPQPRVPSSSSSSGGSSIYIAGFYRHHPSGEYRVLWFLGGHPTYVLTVGSDKPRIIRRPPMTPSLPEHAPRRSLHSCYSLQVNHRDSLHWLIGLYAKTAEDIMVFDTVAETFRWICSPDQLGLLVSLLEIDGKLASCSSYGTIIDVWVMQDYEAEDWALKYRIDLLEMPLPWFALPELYISSMALLNHRELLICNSMSLRGPDCLVHCDIDGKLIGYFKIKEGKHTIYFTNQYFQESIIPLPFSEMQEDKEPPFFIGL